MLSQAATSIGAGGVPRTSGGATLRARAAVVATGVSWRRLGVPARADLAGAGVFCGAAAAEARGRRAARVRGRRRQLRRRAALHLAR